MERSGLRRFWTFSVSAMLSNLKSRAAILLAALVIINLVLNGVITNDPVEAQQLPNSSTNSTTALDYGVGKNAGRIAAVHDFSSLNGRSLYTPRTNQGSSNYRIGYSVGYNEEWKQLVSAANSSMSNSSTSYPSSLSSSSYQNVQRYLVNGTQSLNYTSIGQSLSCADLNESSPHGAVLAATLNCGGGGSAVDSHREGTPNTTHLLATPTTAPQLSMSNSCNNCGSKGNSIYKSGSSNGPSNDNEVPSSSSPLPWIIPPSP
jgi:hypothetical protein